jgi:predicted anti-sigma-YlaC factor YlaD
MKCNHAEKSILLKNSGELAARQSGLLEKHLHECASCRAFERALLQSKTACLPAEEPTVKTLQHVLREARRNAPERKRARIFGLKPVLAMASSLAVILGVFLSNVSPDKVGMILTVTETQLLDYDDQVVSIMYDGLSEDDLAFNFLMTYRDDG